MATRPKVPAALAVNVNIAPPKGKRGSDAGPKNGGKEENVTVPVGRGVTGISGMTKAVKVSVSPNVIVGEPVIPVVVGMRAASAGVPPLPLLS
jgi:hypothetical protein